MKIGKVIDPVDVHLGAKLKQARILAGMSQNKLGQLFGVTFQQIQKNERGINRMSASGLVRFAQILNVPLLYFYEGLPRDAIKADAPKEAAQKNNDLLLRRRETLDLVRAYYRLPNQRLRCAFGQFLKTLVEK